MSNKPWKKQTNKKTRRVNNNIIHFVLESYDVDDISNNDFKIKRETSNVAFSMQEGKIFVFLNDASYKCHVRRCKGNKWNYHKNKSRISK